MAKARAQTFIPHAYLAQEGGVIVGLLLPFATKGETTMPPIPLDAAIWYSDVERPLLLNHDIRKRVGTVRKLWRTDEGVAFLADVDITEGLPNGVSAGLVYYYEEGPEPRVTDVYVYEVSLTDTPAFSDAQVTIALEADARDLDLQKISNFVPDMESKERQEALHALRELLKEAVAEKRAAHAALQTEVDDLTALAERIALLEERIIVLEEAVNTLTARVEALEGAAAQAQAQAQQALGSAEELMRQAQTQLSAVVQDLDAAFAGTLKQLFGTIEKLPKTQKI